jgi:hypothetical protein
MKVIESIGHKAATSVMSTESTELLFFPVRHGGMEKASE